MNTCNDYLRVNDQGSRVTPAARTLGAMMEQVVRETHARTVTKTVAYRALSVLWTVLLAASFGATVEQALSIGALVIVIGSSVYYVHDRAWLLLGWRRDGEGFDSIRRSLAKTAVYRMLMMIASFLTALLVISGSTNQSAALFSVLQMLTGLASYYIVERMFNRLAWGKIK